MLQYAKGKPAIKRSPGWSAFRRKWLKAHPSCAACGTTKSLAVHHIIPLHIDRTKELDITNVITLCEGVTRFCHYDKGHLLNWWKWNTHIVEDAAAYLVRIRESEQQPGPKRR